jgi:tetratricopeptide (TPR) repeat protein
MPNNNAFPISLVSMLVVICLMLGMPADAKEDSVCPDMSGHEQTLNQGEQYLQEHGGGGSSAGFGFDVPTTNPWADPGSSVNVKSEIPVINDWRPGWTTIDAARLEEQINNLPLKTETEIESAEVSLRALEADARYDTARRLLRKMLVARMSITPNNKRGLEDIRADIRRVAMLQSAAVYEKQKQFSAALSVYSLLIHSIASSKDTDLTVKLAFLSPLPHKLDEIGADRIKEVKELQEEALILCTGYRKALQDCGRMAERLDTTGWKLEKAGMNELAEKAFKESLAIKIKILGNDDPDTLAAYGDQARLSADKGHYAEAQNIYERALLQYRKLPNPGRSYATMLENYGDMLNRMNQTTKADAIYAEAKRYYKATKGN